MGGSKGRVRLLLLVISLIKRGVTCVNYPQILHDKIFFTLSFNQRIQHIITSTQLPK